MLGPRLRPHHSPSTSTSAVVAKTPLGVRHACIIRGDASPTRHEPGLEFLSLMWNVLDPPPPGGGRGTRRTPASVGAGMSDPAVPKRIEREILIDAPLEHLWAR